MVRFLGEVRWRNDIMVVIGCRERLAMEHERTGELLANLGSDQTSLHNPYGGGYYPVQLSFEDAQELMTTDPMRFKELVQERLVH